jgi:serine/threonine protein kinase
MGLLSRAFACLQPDFGVSEHYTLIRCLGVGGEGEVWLARPRRRSGSSASGSAPARDASSRAGSARSSGSGSSRGSGDSSTSSASSALVALKLVRRGLTRWQVEAVAAEVQCLLELGEGHVNIVRPTELLLSPTHLALITDFAPGGSLADHLARRRAARLPEHEAAYFMRQILAALRFCHARCITYRDVKPENVLLDGSTPPVLSLCDFGVARRWDRTTGLGSRGMTTVAGTPGYLAPQVLGCMFGRGVAASYDGAAADVWSAGALLTQLLLGRLPYDFDPHGSDDASPTAALRRLWERAQATPWREATSLTGVPPLSPAAVELLDGMLHPNERQRLSLDAVAQHAWVRQPLGEAHEGALAALAARQAALEAAAAAGAGTYSRAEGDCVIAALVQRAAAREAPAAAAGQPRCARLRLAEVPHTLAPACCAAAAEREAGGAATPPQEAEPHAPASPPLSPARGARETRGSLDERVRTAVLRKHSL